MSYIDSATEVPSETFAGAHPSQRSWAPPIYEVMGDHGSPAGISAAPTIIYVDSLITKFHSTEQLSATLEIHVYIGSAHF